MPAKVNDIARRQGISPRYIEQIFICFKKAGIIRTVRGPKGGYMLDKKPEEVSIGDIIRAIEGNIELVGCKSTTAGGEDECVVRTQCVTAPIWNELNSKVFLIVIRNILISIFRFVPILHILITISTHIDIIKLI